MNGKTLLGFIFGGAIGGAAGWYITKKILLEKQEIELEEVRNHFDEEIKNCQELINAANTQNDILVKEVAELTNALNAKAKKNGKKDIPADAVKEEPTEYEKAVEVAKEEAAAVVEEKKPAKKKTSKKKEQLVIFTIEPDDYRENNGFDKETYIWFPDEEIMLDDNDDEIKYYEQLVGYENLEKFGEYEDDVVYVRNTDEKTDYKIIQENVSYMSYMNRSYDR